MRIRTLEKATRFRNRSEAYFTGMRFERETKDNITLPVSTCTGETVVRVYNRDGSAVVGYLGATERDIREAMRT